MARPSSRDLRARIVRAMAQGSSIRQAAARFAVSPATAIKLIQRVRATGRAGPARTGGYRRPLLADHEALLREPTDVRLRITLVEIKAAWAERGIEAGHISAIWSAPRRFDLSHENAAEGGRAEPARRRPPPSPLAGVAALHGCGRPTDNAAHRGDVSLVESSATTSMPRRHDWGLQAGARSTPHPGVTG